MNINSLHVLTDEQLIQMAREGSKTAEEILIEKYRGIAKMKAKLYYIVGADQDDVVQEGMIGLYNAVKGYNIDGSASFKTFAETCIENQILTAIKTANTKKHSPLNESLALEPETDEGGGVVNYAVASETDEPEVEAVLAELIKTLEGSTGSMFSDYEIQVIRQKLKGYDYKEIAENLGKSTKSVDNAIQRIKKKIVAYLEK